MVNEVITTKHGKVEYSLYGRGRTVLFMHGGHSNAHEKLSHKGFDLNNYQLLTPSRPGYGQTPLNNHQTPEKAAKQMVELLDTIGIDKAIVYGISAGGLTAIALAAGYPERVEKLILASAVSEKWLNKDDKMYKAAQVMFHPNIQRITWGMVRLFSSIAPQRIAASFFPQFSSKSNVVIRPGDRKELIDALKQYDSGQGFINDLNQTIDDPLLEAITCPALVIHSEYDASVPVEHARHAHEKIRNSQIVILRNDWGHLFWLGPDSQESIKRIRKFTEE